MAIWRERHGFNFSFPRGKFMAVVFPGDSKDDPCRIEFREYIGDKPTGPLAWKATEENTLVLHVDGITGANSLSEGKSLAQRTAEKLSAGEIQATRKEPYRPPRSAQIEMVEHTNGNAKAIVSQWSEQKYEVMVAVWVPDGTLFPLQTPSISTSRDMSWCRAFDERIYSDDLEEAKVVARQSLELASAMAEKLTAEYKKRKEEGDPQ